MIKRSIYGLWAASLPSCWAASRCSRARTVRPLCFYFFYFFYFFWQFCIFVFLVFANSVCRPGPDPKIIDISGTPAAEDIEQVTLDKALPRRRRSPKIPVPRVRFSHANPLGAPAASLHCCWMCVLMCVCL